MTPTPEELTKQRDEIIEQLNMELIRLNVDFDELLKKSGFTEKDLENLDTSALTPELRAEFEKSVEKAKRDGSARAAHAEAATNSGAATPGMGRKGAIRL